MDENFRFSNRHQYALFLQCKTCQFNKTDEFQFILGNKPGANGKFCKLPFDHKFELMLEHRVHCGNFADSEPIERDTTYPGATFAPWDKHEHLADDSSDIDHQHYAPRSCINSMKIEQEQITINNWDKCLKLFDRKIEEKGVHKFPHHSEVLHLLATSKLPQYGFRLGLPPQKGMGFDRGLWFYRSEKLNYELEKNKDTKAEVRKLIMVYLYNVWFKRLQAPKVMLISKKGIVRPETEDEVKVRNVRFKQNIFLALDCSDKFSLGKDLAWWMLQIFKDEAALHFYPEETFEFEFISMSILDKALEAAQLASLGCETAAELDNEALMYDQLLNSYGYTTDEDDQVYDSDGHQMGESWITQKPVF